MGDKGKTGRKRRGVRTTGGKARAALRRSSPPAAQADVIREPSQHFQLPTLHYLEVAHALDHVGKIVAREIGVVARDVGATPGQLQVVAAIARTPDGLTAKHLAAALAIRPGSLTGMLDQLEARGALARMAVPGDARQSRLVLRAGAEPLVSALEAVNRKIARLLAPVGEDALQRLADLALQVEDSLRDDVGVPVPLVLRTTSPDGIKLPRSAGRAGVEGPAVDPPPAAAPEAAAAAAAPADEVAAPAEVAASPAVTPAGPPRDDAWMRRAMPPQPGPSALRRGLQVVTKIRSTVDAIRGRHDEE